MPTGAETRRFGFGRERESVGSDASRICERGEHKLLGRVVGILRDRLHQVFDLSVGVRGRQAVGEEKFVWLDLEGGGDAVDRLERRHFYASLDSGDVGKAELGLLAELFEGQAPEFPKRPKPPTEDVTG
ncbi:MAG: hypothetical protein KatS3mg104_1806 [Phycisphaerae bacterium]|nr:MAG: hypothetical protein KatS3mg104_1806 [Phycisphaerae bacterium]